MDQDAGLPGHVAAQVIEQLQRMDATGQSALMLEKRITARNGGTIGSVCVSVCQEMAQSEPTYLVKMKDGYAATCMDVDSVATVLGSRYNMVPGGYSKEYMFKFSNGTTIGRVTNDDLKANLRMLKTWKVVTNP